PRAATPRLRGRTGAAGASSVRARARVPTRRPYARSRTPADGCTPRRRSIQTRKQTEPALFLWYHAFSDSPSFRGRLPAAHQPQRYSARSSSEVVEPFVESRSWATETPTAKLRENA